MKKLAAIALALAASAAALSQVTTTAADPGDEDHFKYGSVGIEPEEGLPYWIWQVLPRMFPDKLPGPGGYGSLGFIWEPGRELPVGFSKRNVMGSSRIAVNCAFCHTATYRTADTTARVIVPGGATTILAAQAFSRFLEAAAADPRFNASEMLTEIGKIGKLSFAESTSYRLFLIPGTRRALQRHREEFAWMDGRTSWGRGRIDPLNPFKYRQLKQPLDGTIGNSDMTPLWSLGLRDGRALHWDGLNPSLDEVLISSGIGNGASVKSVDIESLERVGLFLRELKPPAYPFPVDKALAERGAQAFQSECAACHAPDGARMGEVIPIEEIATDRHRLDTWTADSAEAFNRLAAGKPWQFAAFRKTRGYVAMPLAGVWLNAPYLHNGSVPTLTDLLEPAANRPASFYRGYDVYDRARAGFVAAGPDAERHGEAFDTGLPGNASVGHEYGTTLPPEVKTALVEYLKTQ
jgi:mono/diheme cytochrome c family protein